MLLNSANERLCGTQFSYFPVGGPTPSCPYVGEPPDMGGPVTERQLGSVRFAERSLYQCESVDGVVTEFGGPELEELCRTIEPVSYRRSAEKDETLYPVRCPPGDARWTPSAGGLKQVFKGGIVHAVAPFWTDRGEPNAGTNKAQLLANAYASSFKIAFESDEGGRSHPTDALICPLLGAGARGAPPEEAAKIAMSAANEWLYSEPKNYKAVKHRNQTIRFGVYDEDHADLLADLLSDVS